LRCRGSVRWRGGKRRKHISPPLQTIGRGRNAIQLELQNKKKIHSKMPHGLGEGGGEGKERSGVKGEKG